MLRFHACCISIFSFLLMGMSPLRNRDEVDFIASWNELALKTIRQEKTAPPLAVQQLAVLHLAMFEAANRASRRYLSMIDGPENAAMASLEIQRLHIAAAAHRVLKSFAPAPIMQKADQFLQGEHLATVAAEELKAHAVEDAYRLSETLIQAHLSHNGMTAPNTTPPLGVGYWEPTPPLYADYLLPGWGKIRPWLLVDQADALRPPGPPALNSAAYAAAFDEVKRLGSLTSEARTPEQTATALFWADGSGTSTPPGHWNIILRDHLKHCENDLVDITRIYALLNMAVADACIATWDAKWSFYFWRPITAIRQAQFDGNEATAPDPNWEPLLATPPFPSYVSGHASISAAAAAILQDFFRDRLTSIQVTSESLPHVRHYPNFFSAAQEAAYSRILGGIHFDFDSVDGLWVGRNIGQTFTVKALLPRPGSKDGVAGRMCR